MKYVILMKKEIKKELEAFLLNREYDIATSFEDFGCLENVFKEIVGREPTDKEVKP